mmetsp:Transcript_37855/g.90580  ORF Transcript_37855/g.90580 Transcript_37855/m.90580 type:complete len:271 (-) Transcript_37855:217-1029(-)
MSVSRESRKQIASLSLRFLPTRTLWPLGERNSRGLTFAPLLLFLLPPRLFLLPLFCLSLDSIVPSESNLGGLKPVFLDDRSSLCWINTSATPSAPSVEDSDCRSSSASLNISSAAELSTSSSRTALAPLFIFLHCAKSASASSWNEPWSGLSSSLTRFPPFSQSSTSASLTPDGSRYRFERMRFALAIVPSSLWAFSSSRRSDAVFLASCDSALSTESASATCKAGGVSSSDAWSPSSRPSESSTTASAKSCTVDNSRSSGFIIGGGGVP